MFDFNEYHAQQLAKYPRMVAPRIIPQVIGQDGRVWSIQASKYHYCQPREDAGPYYLVEVGIMDGGEAPELAQWQDGDGSFVHGYVPVEVIERLVGEDWHER